MAPERRALEEFVDLVCLVYHEARNARREYVPNGLPGDVLCDRLPSVHGSKYDAWCAMGDARMEAYKANSVAGVKQVFAERYSLDLDGLERLFKDERWKRRFRLGGPKWAEICRRVTSLARALEGSDEAAISDARSLVLDAEHNTSRGPGGVRRKLEDLRRRCG